MRLSFVLALALTSCAITASAEPTARATSSSTSEPPLVRVSSSDAVAIVIDGTPCGNTPALVEVSSGRHRVELIDGAHRFVRVVNAVPNQIVEVDLARDRRPTRPALSHEPWARRVFLWPLVELQLLASTSTRRFDVPINPAIDTSGRTSASFESGAFGLLGFKISLYPFSRLGAVLVRGLGVEGSAVFDVGLAIVDSRLGEEVDASFTEATASLVYNVVIGRHDRGAIISARLGWQRTEFILGEMGNDIVPPFTYETMRIEAGGRAPLGTRHLLVDAGVAYLATLSVGNEATRAYGASGTQPSTHGGEVYVGLLHRIGRIEIGLTWRGRWFRSEFDGTGQGWGDIPSTRILDGGDGIETTGPARDSIHQLRFSLGYRF